MGFWWVSVDADHLEGRVVGGSYKEDLKEVGWEGLDWSHGDQWQGPRLSHMLGMFWRICCQFPRRTMLRIASSACCLGRMVWFGSGGLAVLV
jgi:hypothetical protein